MNFIGSTADLGYGTPQIKGAFIVQKVDEKIAKAMKEQPGQFGYGIVKASRWGGQKPKLVLLCKDAKLAGQKEERPSEAYRQPTPEERAEAQFLRNHVESVFWGVALEKIDLTKETLVALLGAIWENGYNPGSLVALLTHAGVKVKGDENRLPTQAFEKVALGPLTKLVFLVLLSCVNVEVQGFLPKKVDLKKVLKEAEAEARKLWAARPKENGKATQEVAKTAAEK